MFVFVKDCSFYKRKAKGIRNNGKVTRVLVKFIYWEVSKSSLHKNVQFDTKLHTTARAAVADQIIGNK